jgi:hypothetical protein
VPKPTNRKKPSRAKKNNAGMQKIVINEKANFLAGDILNIP